MMRKLRHGPKDIAVITGTNGPEFGDILVAVLEPGGALSAVTPLLSTRP